MSARETRRPTIYESASAPAQAPGPRRRSGALVAVLLVAVAVGAVVLLRAPARPARAAVTASPSPTASASRDAGAPGSRLADLEVHRGETATIRYRVTGPRAPTVGDPGRHGRRRTAGQGPAADGRGGCRQVARGGRAHRPGAGPLHLRAAVGEAATSPPRLTGPAPRVRRPPHPLPRRSSCSRRCRRASRARRRSRPPGSGSPAATATSPSRSSTPTARRRRVPRARAVPAGEPLQGDHAGRLAA